MNTSNPTSAESLVAAEHVGSMVATWAVIDPADPGAGGTMTVRNAVDVDALLEVLGQPDVTAALVHHRARLTVEFEGEAMPDHELSVGVHNGFGYFSHADADHEYAVSVGDPKSPPFPAYYVEYDAGGGVDLATCRAALTEFLTTAQRPASITWRMVA